jgi:hypothetical protein
LKKDSEGWEKNTGNIYNSVIEGSHSLMRVWGIRKKLLELLRPKELCKKMEQDSCLFKRNADYAR